MYRICERCGAHLDPGERCDCLPPLVIVRKRYANA